MQLLIAFLFWHFWTTSNTLGLISTILLTLWYITQRLYEMYIAVMGLRDRRKEGTLSEMDQVFGRITLVRGLLYDVLVNTTLGTLLFLEVPKWFRFARPVHGEEDSKRQRLINWLRALFPLELLLTPRLKRLARLPANSKYIKKYRRWFSRIFLRQIDQHDLSGGHNVPE